MRQKGFTIFELLIVITVIGILSSMAFIGITDSQKRGRDTHRTADIDTLHSRLEEYYADKGAYPNTISTAVLPGLPADALIDPDGVSITINSPVASQATAAAVTNPTGTPNDYVYIPYPTGCGLTTCRGYILKSFVEKPTAPITNPYVRSGLYNN
jgi:type IV pilus assembly protein PilA